MKKKYPMKEPTSQPTPLFNQIYHLLAGWTSSVLLGQGGLQVNTLVFTPPLTLWIRDKTQYGVNNTKNCSKNYSQVIRILNMVHKISKVCILLIYNC